MKLSALCRRLDSILNSASVRTDPSQNGLQVGGEWEVKRVAFAVDATGSTMAAAAEGGADLLVMHHGLLWGGPVTWTGHNFDRLRVLVENRVALYAAHLPLDMHPTLGNNAGLIKILGLRRGRSFGEYGGMEIGFTGTFQKPADVEVVRGKYEAALGTGGRLFGFGPPRVKTVAAFSGGIDATVMESAARRGIDLLVTGEVKHSHYAVMEDARLNVLALGHYVSETIGVRALMKHVAGHYPVETFFIDHPTGL